MRSVTEFDNAGGFRDQELHIAIRGHVPDLLSPQHRMDGNNDGIGQKYAQDRDDLIKRLLHANPDSVARSDAQLSEALRRRDGLGVEFAERQRFAPAENSGLVGDSRQRLLELCGYRCQLRSRAFFFFFRRQVKRKLSFLRVA